MLAGGCLPLAPIRALIREADVVLALGTELGETDYEYHGEGPVAFSGTLIRVDIDPRQLGRNAAPTLPIVGDAGLVTDGAAAAVVTTTRTTARSGRGRRAGRPRLGRAAPRPPWPSLEAIWRVLPEAVAAGDSTGMSYACCLFGETPGPRRWMSASTGFGTLGYALPAAIGAKLAAPERPSLCLIGDGGLHYTLPELAAAADAGAPVIVVLWNDRRYAEIETYMLKAGAEPTGVSAPRRPTSRPRRGLRLRACRAALPGRVRGRSVARRRPRPFDPHRTRRVALRLLNVAFAAGAAGATR